MPANDESLPVNVEDYELRLPAWRELEQEAVYTLKEAISGAGLKVHAIESRIKDLVSLIGKVASKQYSDPLDQVNDIVGIRLVTLFLSDLAKIDAIIESEFCIISKDDKTQNDDSAVGYRSIHYICTVKPEYIGPRYKKIAGHNFEIQVRTLCMHAWSAVSHYIEYKADWDVPKELMGSLKALSGLFHIADSQFEQFYKAREEYYKNVPATENTTKTEINLDSVAKFLLQVYPDRRSVPQSELSSFVQELSQLEIKTIEQLSKKVKQAEAKLKVVESKRKREFANLGAARVSLGLVSQKYRDIQYDGATLKEAQTLFAQE